MDEFDHEGYYEELNRIERIFYNEYHSGQVSDQTQFDYGWCLIRSKYSADIKKGTMLMEELCIKSKENDRDFLYFLAVGNAKLKDYGRALKCVRACLNLEPENKQIEKLEMLIKRKMRDEKIALRAMLGLAIAGVATVGFWGCRYLRRYFHYLK